MAGRGCCRQPLRATPCRLSADAVERSSLDEGSADGRSQSREDCGQLFPMAMEDRRKEAFGDVEEREKEGQVWASNFACEAPWRCLDWPMGAVDIRINVEINRQINETKNRSRDRPRNIERYEVIQISSLLSVVSSPWVVVLMLGP